MAAADALEDLAQEVFAQVLATASALEADPDALKLAWVRPFQRVERGREQMVRGHDTSVQPGAGLGYIPEPKWLEGQHRWETAGETIWRENQWKAHPGAEHGEAGGDKDTGTALHEPDAGGRAQAAAQAAAPRPLTGAAAVHPQVGHAPVTPGDTISQHAYRHVPRAVAQPFAPPRQYQVPDHPGPLTMPEVDDRVNHMQDVLSQAMFDGLSTRHTQTMPGDGPGGRVWTPERADQHNQIVNSLMAKHDKVPSEGRAVIMGGTPGAGKSTVRGQLPGDYMPIDADAIKEEMANRNMIPQVEDLSPMESSTLVHEESRYLARLLATTAMAQHRNIAIESTMSDAGAVLKYVKALRVAGYPEVRAAFTDTDPALAADRMDQRYRQGLEDWRNGKGLGGRYIPGTSASQQASAARGTFDAIKHEFDGHQVWDTRGSSPKLVSDYAPLADQEYQAHTARVEQSLADAVRFGKSTNETQTLGQSGNGYIWKPGRAAQHNDIVQQALDKARHVPSEGKAVIAGGLGGAGKSTVLGKFAGVDKRNFLTVNPDDIKEEMVRRGMVPQVGGLSPMEASALIHEESSHVANLLAQQAYAQRKNIIWDITMSSPGSVGRRLDEMEKAGYGDIGSVFVHIPVETSVERALARHRRGLEAYRQGAGAGGRYVPPSVIRSAERSGGSTANRDTFEQLKGRFTRTQLWDNSGRRPRLLGKTGPEPQVPSPKDIIAGIKSGTISPRTGEPAAANAPGLPWTGRPGGRLEFHDSLGIPREQMPQLSGLDNAGAYHPSTELIPQFLQRLQDAGIPYTHERVPASDLHPVQAAGDMQNVRSIADSIRSGKIPDTKPIMVSEDNRVLDGHHTWAARLLADSEGGREGLKPDMPVIRVHQPIGDLMSEVQAFDAEHGIKPRGQGEIANPALRPGAPPYTGAAEAQARAAEKGTAK